MPCIIKATIMVVWPISLAVSVTAMVATDVTLGGIITNAATLLVVVNVGDTILLMSPQTTQPIGFIFL